LNFLPLSIHHSSKIRTYVDHGVSFTSHFCSQPKDAYLPGLGFLVFSTNCCVGAEDENVANLCDFSVTDIETTSRW